jgi:hypothetical protein
LAPAGFECVRQPGKKTYGFLAENGLLRIREGGVDLYRLLLCGKHEMVPSRCDANAARKDAHLGLSDPDHRSDSSQRVCQFLQSGIY